MKLNTRFNVLKYLFLRNDLVWNQLDEEVKKKILENNTSHNSEREDYANPMLYGAKRLEGGEIWENNVDRAQSERGQFVTQIFLEKKPKSVLEIGPGGGFFTRFYCEQDFTRRYVAVEISRGFVEYLKSHLNELKKEKKIFSFDVLNGSAPYVLPNEKFDFIVLSSVVHHIPNREDLFSKLSDLLNPNGLLVCVDPSHYLARIITLGKKCLKGSYIRNIPKNGECPWSTHHFCTFGEYKKIINKSKDLRITHEYYHANKKFRFLKTMFPRLSSDEIGIVFRKDS